MAPLFLGLDLSTQQLKAVLVQEDCTIVHESAVHFDNDLPQYGTVGGAIKGPDQGEVTSPVQMWLDAFDLLMERMKKANVEFGEIKAVSGAGQQHGSVYWSAGAKDLLASLDPTKKLSSQLSPNAFSYQKAPIWQDSSTGRECQELEDAVGGPQALADISGSRAYHRFTGPQIARIRRLFPDVYNATSRISLVSSFIPSLFLGEIVPIEVSDASGMNLMDVFTCKWDDRLLEVCGGPEMRSKLGPEPVPGGSSLGKISNWWVERWGFSTDCLVAPFTGDNPATVVALSFPGDALLSLGTSTTFLLSIPPEDSPPKRFTTSHLLSHPTDAPDAQIAMLCYKNGGLAREQVRDEYADKDWAKYNTFLEGTTPGPNGHLGIYFPLPEIIPPEVQGNFFFDISSASSPTRIEQSAIPRDAHPRLILESQFLSIKSRIAAILPSDAPPLHRLVVTGGGSANQTIRQLAADIFHMKVYISATKEAAGMGGALLAMFAWWKQQDGNKAGTFEEMIAASGGSVLNHKCVAEPKLDPKVYEALVEPYRLCEDETVRLWAEKNRIREFF